MNWLRAAKIWWYLAWRTMLLTVIVAFVVGALLGVVLAVFGIPLQQIELAGNVAGGLIGVLIGIWIVTYLPSKTFSDFQVVLQKRSEQVHAEVEEQ